MIKEKDMEMMSIDVDDLADISGGTAASYESVNSVGDIVLKGQKAGGSGLPRARSMSAGANDLAVENPGYATRAGVNTVVMTCPKCGETAQQLCFSGGRMKCTACLRVHL